MHCRKTCVSVQTLMLRIEAKRPQVSDISQEGVGQLFFSSTTCKNGSYALLWVTHVKKTGVMSGVLF